VNGSLKLVAPLIAAVAIAACNAGGSSNLPSSAAGNSQVGQSVFNQHMPQWLAKHQAKAACPQIVGKPSCQVLLINKGVRPDCSPSSNCGFTPKELQTAYGLTPYLGSGSGTIVALIEVGDYSNAASDLSTYRTEYGLGTGTLVRYNAAGVEGSYPSTCDDYGWCLETALDMEMVSSSCPDCTIYIMEAEDSISSLEEAETSAVTLGAKIISNSWSCPEDWDCEDTNFPNYFDTSGVTYLASTGDDAYNTIGGPSDLDSVIGVGGTQLRGSGSKFTETVWSDASAGCSSPSVVGNPGVSKPSWQADPDCKYRTDGDISAEAGCEPGVSEYSGYYGGWVDVCGTSVASPLTAGIIAIAGNGGTFQGGERFWDLSKKSVKKDLHDITSGDDGSCGNEYLCDAGLKKKHGGYKTYSGPTGWGTPNGVAAY
jgi:subtilase family serine protease